MDISYMLIVYNNTIVVGPLQYVHVWKYAEQSEAEKLFTMVRLEIAFKAHSLKLKGG